MTNSPTLNTPNSMFYSKNIIERKALEEKVMKLIRLFSSMADTRFYINSSKDGSEVSFRDATSEFDLSYENHLASDLIKFEFVASDSNYISLCGGEEFLACQNTIFEMPDYIMSLLARYAYFDLMDFDFKLSGNIKFGGDIVDDHVCVCDLSESVLGFEFDTPSDCFLRNSYRNINDELMPFVMWGELIEKIYKHDMTTVIRNLLNAALEKIFKFLAKNKNQGFEKTMTLCEISNSIDPMLRLIERHRNAGV